MSASDTPTEPTHGGVATATDTAPRDQHDAPPAGEDIHLPGGTPLPLLIALAVTLTLVGTTVGWIWTILGGILFIVCLTLWIRDSRREYAHLPAEHGAGHAAPAHGASTHH